MRKAGNSGYAHKAEHALAGFDGGEKRTDEIHHLIRLLRIADVVSNRTVVFVYEQENAFACFFVEMIS